jgi:hypothetical protein
MFPDGIPDLQSLMSQAAEMQQRVVAAQQELAETRVVGTSGGGLVMATVTGTGELVHLHLDPQVVDPEDPETLADLVLAAVRDANNAAQQLAAEQMGDITGGFGDLGGPGGTGQLPGHRPGDGGEPEPPRGIGF